MKLERHTVFWPLNVSAYFKKPMRNNEDFKEAVQSVKSIKTVCKGDFQRRQ